MSVCDLRPERQFERLLFFAYITNRASERDSARRKGADVA